MAESAMQAQRDADQAAARVASTALQVATLLAASIPTDDKVSAAATAAQLAALVTTEAATAARHTALAASMVARAAVVAAAQTASAAHEAARSIERDAASSDSTRGPAKGASDETLWVVAETARIERIAEALAVAGVMAETVARSAEHVQLSAEASAVGVAEAATRAASMVAAAVAAGDEVGAALAASELAAQVSTVATATARETSLAAVQVAKSAASAAVDAATEAAETARLMELSEISDLSALNENDVSPAAIAVSNAAESARIARSAEVATEVFAMALRVERTAAAIQVLADSSAARVADSATDAAALVAESVPVGEERAAAETAIRLAAAVTGAAATTAQETAHAAMVVAREATEAATESAAAAADTARMIQRAVVSAARAMPPSPTPGAGAPHVVPPTSDHQPTADPPVAISPAPSSVSTDQITIFLVDDQELVRRGLIDLFAATNDLVVVGEASTAADALHRIPTVQPDVAILDGRLLERGASSLCHDLHASHPGVFIVILASDENDEALFDAVTAGAAGYLLKTISGPSLIDAIREVAAGRSLMDPSLTGRLLDRVRHPVVADARLKNLTARDLQILELVTEGLANREIAARLTLAEATVKNYVSALLTKLNLHSRTQVALLGANLAKSP